MFQKTVALATFVHYEIGGSSACSAGLHKRRRWASPFRERGSLRHLERIAYGWL